MKDYLDKLPLEIKDLIYRAADIASCNNMPVYLVGGFVRDLLLGESNLDLDIVVEGDGIKFAEEFSRLLKAEFIRHRRFGTATIMLKPSLKPVPGKVEGLRIDIATARKEYYPAPAHLPVVSSGSLRDDLLRRDFTVNAMAMSLNSHNFARLIDSFDGQKDLKAKKIRTLHSLSFIDDPTRILRAIRFEQRYNFRIEPATLKSLKEAVKLKMLEKTEPQRVRDELILILKEEHILEEIERLNLLAGLRFISPRLSVSKSTFSLMRSIGEQISWFQSRHPKRRKLDSWLIYFMGLLDPLSLSQAKSICRKFAFRRGEEKRTLTYKAKKDKLMRRLNRKIRPAQVFTLLEPLSYEVIILLKAKFKSRLMHRQIEDFFREYNGMRIHIRGADLSRLGFEPGPNYQRLFARVLQAKLDGILKTKEEEILFIKKLIKNK